MTWIVEAPIGIVDGANRRFRCSYTPNRGTLTVDRNGQALVDPADYGLTGSQVNFGDGHVPQPGDRIVLRYEISDAISPVLQSPGFRRGPTRLDGSQLRDASVTADKLAPYTAENMSVSTIPAGAAVMQHSGGTGIALADGTRPVLGLAGADIASHVAGTVLDVGRLQLADWTPVTGSATLSTGATYYLDPIAAGHLTSTAPTTAGQQVQAVGVTVTPDTIEIRIMAPILL